nr:diguanylate cyclase [Arenimonas sp.]
GLRYLDLTLELIDRVPDPELRSHGWFAASALYQQMGQYELSQHYAERIFEASAVPRTRCFAGLQILDAKRQLDQLPADDAPIKAVVRECEAQGETLVSGFARGILARQWARRGDTAPAIALLEQHMAEVEATAYPRLIGEIQSLLGELHLAEGNLEAASRYARLALDRRSDLSFSQPLVQAHRTLYQSALQRGDTAGALRHHIDYADADKAYLDHIKAREIAYQAVKHETREKTQTIELLNSQNRLLQLEQQVTTKSTQATRLLIALLAVLLASIGYWAVKTKKMQVQFRHLAQTDALTGISNRHHFTRRAEALLEQCRKGGEEAGLVMLDLDNFKSINDQFGHAAGDWTLKQVAQVCEQLRGPRDLVGRLGGEEFAFLVVGSDAAAGTALAEACRERIAGIDTGQSGHRFGITASFGVAGSRACGFGFDTLLARADDALYRSKREGRNRVTVHAADQAPGAGFAASQTA